MSSRGAAPSEGEAGAASSKAAISSRLVGAAGAGEARGIPAVLSFNDAGSSNRASSPSLSAGDAPVSADGRSVSGAAAAGWAAAGNTGSPRSAMSESRSAFSAASISSSIDGRAGAAAGLALPLISRSRDSMGSSASAAGVAGGAGTGFASGMVAAGAGAGAAGAGLAATSTPTEESRPSTALSSAVSSSAGASAAACGWPGMSRWFSKSSTSSMPGMTICSLGLTSGPWEGASGPLRLGDVNSSAG